MFAINKHAAAIAIGLAIAATASPSLAQRSENPMSSAREQALRECSGQAGKNRPGGLTSSTRSAPACTTTASRNKAQAFSLGGRLCALPSPNALPQPFGRGQAPEHQPCKQYCDTQRMPA